MESNEKVMTCVKAFDYLTEGEKYIVEIGGKAWHFWNVERRCGTFIPVWQCERAVKAGFLV